MRQPSDSKEVFPRSKLKLRSLNIILIGKRLGESWQWGPEALCDSFDLSCCCAAMVVQQDLKAEIQFFHNASEHLRSSVFKLLPCSFSRQSADVDAQMVRVLKYVRRGFRFVQDH